MDTFRKIILLSFAIFSITSVFLGYYFSKNLPLSDQNVLETQTTDSYWFLLHRKSNVEKLYQGIPGNVEQSKLIKTFKVKTGIPGERPTPLPQLVGREYWRIVNKSESFDNPETAPYFFQFDTDAPSEWPYGPTPYEECGGQCDWGMPGYFGLHGTGGNPAKLSEEDPGSSGCVRHSDEDITFLYNLLDPKAEEIRYYIEDN